MPDKKQIMAYQAAMAQARAMFHQGILDERDLVEAECIFARKYRINSGSLYREIDLINLGFRANMSQDEGGEINAKSD